ncbi:radical SAM protein [Bradyrhizobium japonicum]|uniref:radical SAM protein n=1 Tax=Bradyrhizobium japonicum TaxID=375 RepID=UPI000577D4F3|nr:radical SAM protein [Bradyrhizobium japonicum]
MQLSNQSYIGLGRVPVGIGAVLKGWNISEAHYRDQNTLPVVNFRAMTNACPFNCFHCFTEKMKKTLSLAEIKNVIDQLADLNTHTIDFVGEGEPTIDKDFFEIVEYTASKNIQPVVYTEAATRLRNKEFAMRLFNSGASVCPKCDSLYNAEYQNWVVGDKRGSYFDQRNEAIQLLMECGFNKVHDDGTTRMGFDMVVSKRNYHEVESTLRYCRDNNLWIIFVFYLTSGRSAKDTFDKELEVTEAQKAEIRQTVRRVDAEYDYHHNIWNNFATARCIEFVQIFGDGRVSACPGNENSIGNVREASIRELKDRLLAKYPYHDKTKFDGHCPYRAPIDFLTSGGAPSRRSEARQIGTASFT